MSEHVSTHTDPSDIVPSLMAPVKPHVIVLFGATGDLARRKLLPVLFHLAAAELMPDRYGSSAHPAGGVTPERIRRCAGSGLVQRVVRSRVAVTRPPITG